MIGCALILDIDLKPSAYRPFFMSHLGDSGQNQMPHSKMKDGMKAEPSCKRQEMAPVFLTITFAANPRKIPDLLAVDRITIALINAYLPRPKVAKT